MTQAVAQILAEVAQLSPAEQVDLTDRLVATVAEATPADIHAAQMQEVRRRIAEVESGEVALIPGEEALAQVRASLARGFAEPR